ncbi:hypothetical protein GCM10010219_65280 [Streptomyces netropsis]|nr:hypothetical protein GCM10010219_65280 [Streptomyces netropsis]
MGHGEMSPDWMRPILVRYPEDPVEAVMEADALAGPGACFRSRNIGTAAPLAFNTAMKDHSKAGLITVVDTAPGAFERHGQPVFCLALDDIGERPGPLSLGIRSARRRTPAAAARG